MKTRFLGACAALVLLAASSPASANLIIDGSFESPSIGAVFYQNYGAHTDDPWSGSSFSLAWSIKPDTNVDIVNPIVGWGAGATAYAGQQILDLVGYGSTGGIEQFIPTQAGKTYTFSFAYANNPGTPGAAASYELVGINTVLSGLVNHSSSVNDALNWTIYSGTFVADNSSTRLRFDTTFGANNGGIMLDAVSVSAVPEASTWIMMLIGFAGIGFAAYRRAKKAEPATA